MNLNINNYSITFIVSVDDKQIDSTNYVVCNGIKSLWNLSKLYGVNFKFMLQCLKSDGTYMQESTYKNVNELLEIVAI